MELRNQFAKQVFFTNFFKGESANVESKILSDAIENNLLSPEIIEHLKTSTLIEAINNDPLPFSNDLTCDFIVKLVFLNTMNKKLGEIIRSIYVGYVAMERRLPRPYVYIPFYDKSRLVIIDATTAYQLDQINEIITIKFMRKYGYFDKLSKDFDESLLNKLLFKFKDPYSKKYLFEYEDYIITSGGEELFDNYAILLSEIYEVSLGFIIGHEVGHCYLEHSGYSDDTQINHDMEIEADECAVLFIKEFLNFYKQKIDQGHEELQLSGIASAIIYMAISSTKSPFQFDSTHPSLRKRYLLVIFSIFNRFSKKCAMDLVEIVKCTCEETKLHSWDEKWWVISPEFFEKIEEKLPEIRKNAKIN
ncbi:phage exclusion protein Lit family protein [Paenibacillus donghaensis]|uniref:phage exclusion protein Lit family protein n=1 Tax=Paenibacillus donghaensis TaxID=414771 RepID=UPI0012FE3A21|nr:phage exclusion protein Lit family protein [Paenibacillus donghaensis]